MGVRNVKGPAQVDVPDLVDDMAEDGVQFLQLALSFGSTRRGPLLLHIDADAAVKAKVGF